jgi:hypothetical protein
MKQHTITESLKTRESNKTKHDSENVLFDSGNLKLIVY